MTYFLRVIQLSVYSRLHFADPEEESEHELNKTFVNPPMLGLTEKPPREDEPQLPDDQMEPNRRTDEDRVPVSKAARKDSEDRPRSRKISASSDRDRYIPPEPIKSKRRTYRDEPRHKSYKYREPQYNPRANNKSPRENPTAPETSWVRNEKIF